jgi:hypothetical protein
MANLSTVSLDTLINMAQTARLIDRHHKTEWIVALYMDDAPFVMNHIQAQIFLQGLLQGAWRQQRAQAHWTVEPSALQHAVVWDSVGTSPAAGDWIVSSGWIHL